MDEKNYRNDKIMRQAHKKMEEIRHHYQEAGQVHNSGEVEKRKLESIKTGDVEKAILCIKEGFDGEFGTLSRNPMRSSKNLAIVAIASFSRAAIEGGMHWEQAYATSDAFILMADEAKDTKTLFTIVEQSLYFYAEEIHNLKKKTEWNIYVEECKKMIFKHLHEKIEVKQIAEQLQISSGYLERLFLASEGITIKNAIQKEKIKVSQNMLIYSDYTCSEIALYLGFCSQSHFGKVFSKETGMSPNQYRKRYGKLGFVK